MSPSPTNPVPPSPEEANPYSSPEHSGAGVAPPPMRLRRFTVIAVLNFIFAGLGMIALLSLIGVSGGKLQGSTRSIVLGIALLATGALVAGGIGLLRSARWGWVVMVVYCVLAILSALYSVGSSGHWAGIRSAVYPIVVLVLLLDRPAREAVGL